MTAVIWGMLALIFFLLVLLVGFLIVRRWGRTYKDNELIGGAFIMVVGIMGAIYSMVFTLYHAMS